MLEYEKGSPAWDIGQVLTIHASRAHGDATDCAKVESLLASRGQPAHLRIARAHKASCTCGKGESPAEHTTERKDHERATLAAGSQPAA